MFDLIWEFLVIIQVKLSCDTLIVVSILPLANDEYTGPYKCSEKQVDSLHKILFNYVILKKMINILYNTQVIHLLKSRLYLWPLSAAEVWTLSDTVSELEIL